MKKNKKHKWKYQLNIKKKIVVLVILGVSLFVGLGYAILGSNFGMTGTLEVGKYDRTIAGVMKKNAGNGYIVKYTGAHQDSMDPAKSTEDIYYFTADTAAKAATVKNMNNVVFADMCWSIIRTTDTGGVRLLYNGEPTTTIVDGVTQYDCSDNRNLYHIGGIKTTLSLSGTYVYAKNYTATTSGKNTTFTLIDDPEDDNDYKSIQITSSNAAEKIAEIAANYPYTCRKSSGSCTNEGFYKVDSQSSGVNAYVYAGAKRDSLGMSIFNEEATRLASAGYMYGPTSTYDITNWMGDYIEIEPTSQNIYSTTITLGTSYYYSSNYDYGVTTSGKYTLTSPTQITSETNYSNLVGKYTINSNGSTNSIYYVIAVYNTNKAYVKELKNGNQDVSISFSDSLNSSFNALDNPTTIELKDYYSNYANYAGKYTCGDSSTSCSSPKYIDSTTATTYKYIEGTITASKTRNGDALVNPETFHRGVFYRDYETVYNQYHYICGDGDDACTPANLKYISDSSYSYDGELNLIAMENHYYGASVTYQNGEYTLQNTIGLEAVVDMSNLVNNHFMCLESGEKTCQSVAYIYLGHDEGYYRYVLLSGGVTSIDDTINNELRTNTYDSVAKTKIDAWYEYRFLNTAYESKLDDVIYCNDRSYRSPDIEYNVDYAPFSISGWNANGGNPSYSLAFNNGWSTNDLSCANVTDRFSVSNNSAKLKYKIALPTSSETDLSDEAVKPTVAYWTMSPGSIGDGYPYGDEADVMGNVVSTSSWTGTAVDSDDVGLRPAIALTAETTYARGNGSGTNPFVVDMSN